MIIKDRLKEFRSYNPCNLEMFKSRPVKHDTKKWISKDGTAQLIRNMETMHLWNVFKMLVKIIETEAVYIKLTPPDAESVAHEAYEHELDNVIETAYIAKNALQYIGHELYRREMRVPRLPNKKFMRNVNRAENLNAGFFDSQKEGLKWYNGE